MSKLKKKSKLDFRPGLEEKGEERKVIGGDSLSSDEKAQLIRLQKLLYPNDQRPINLQLIPKGVEKLAEILPQNALMVLMNYCKKENPQPDRKKELRIKEILNQIPKFELAVYFVDGFEYCVKLMATKLTGAPEDMGNIQKAKFLFSYMVVFFDYHLFLEDFVEIKVDGEIQKVPFPSNISQNNVEMCGPERMFLVHDLFFGVYPNLHWAYPLMIKTLNELSDNSKEKFGEFAKMMRMYTYGELRAFKLKIFPYKAVGFNPLFLFLIEQEDVELNMVEIYKVYRLLSAQNVPQNSQEQEIQCVKANGKELTKIVKLVTCVGEYQFASEFEISCFKRYVEYLRETGKKFQVILKGANINEEESIELDFRLFMIGLEFLLKLGYYTQNSVDADKEILLVTALFRNYKEKNLEDYLQQFDNEKIGAEELKKLLGITPEDEEEIFGLVCVQEPQEAFENFYTNHGFGLNDENRSRAMEILYEPFAKYFELLGKKEISTEKLEQLVGYNWEVVSWIFDLEKLKYKELTEILQDFAKDKIRGNMDKKTRARVLSISGYMLLYKYLVDHNLGKPKKGLKISALMNLLERALQENDVK